MKENDRFFDPEPSIKNAAKELYTSIKKLPIVSPHGHVDPALFSSKEKLLGNPVELFLQTDHYLLRMLHSQGIPYQVLLSKENPRQVWMIFAENCFLFRGTPSGVWLDYEFEEIFGIEEKLSGITADKIYDQLEMALVSQEYSPRRLFERFKIEALATTDSATDTLAHHQEIRSSGWKGRIIPTFRLDDVLNINHPEWVENIHNLSLVSRVEIIGFQSFIHALEHQRAYFKSLGGTATDVSPADTRTIRLTEKEADVLFQRALKKKASQEDAAQFSAYLLFEMARMSTEDGLVMQIHPGVFRNHNTSVLSQFGCDRGFDIPICVEFTHNLRPLLDNFGNNPGLSLILFTLDETTYTRELAPLAGVYSSVKLGPPWWFNDSLNGMRRYFDQVMETAGLYNTVGFNDDTRAFISIPARHDVWRRAAANWLANLQIRDVIDHTEAESMAIDLAVGLARKAYHL